MHIFTPHILYATLIWYLLSSRSENIASTAEPATDVLKDSITIAGFVFAPPISFSFHSFLILPCLVYMTSSKCKILFPLQWLNNCVGKKNYTTFILLMIFVLLMVSCFLPWETNYWAVQTETSPFYAVNNFIATTTANHGRRNCYCHICPLFHGQKWNRAGAGAAALC